MEILTQLLLLIIFAFILSKFIDFALGDKWLGRIIDKLINRK